MGGGGRGSGQGRRLKVISDTKETSEQLSQNNTELDFLEICLTSELCDSLWESEAVRKWLRKRVRFREV